MATVRLMKRAAFEQAGIPEDGGDSSPWVDFKLGPIPMPFPNTDARRAAVKLHDVHHVLTGYRMDIIGEFEISAWEIAAGCGRFPVAWFLNLMGLTLGLVVSPRRVSRAFWRGARSSTLYREPRLLERVLDLEPDEARSVVGVHEGPASATLGGVLQLGAAVVAGVALMLLTAVLALNPISVGVWGGMLVSYRRAAERSTPT